MGRDNEKWRLFLSEVYTFGEFLIPDVQWSTGFAKYVVDSQGHHWTGSCIKRKRFRNLFNLKMPILFIQQSCKLKLPLWRLNSSSSAPLSTSMGGRVILLMEEIRIATWHVWNLVNNGIFTHIYRRVSGISSTNSMFRVIHSVSWTPARKAMLPLLVLRDRWRSNENNKIWRKKTRLKVQVAGLVGRTFHM